MCGIAGWTDFNANLSQEENTINKMSVALYNRGPDEGGFFRGTHTVLIHRRLVVVDPDNGKQPMYLTDKKTTYSMVYNGELYNTEDLRKELISRGHSFSGHSDTEVLIHAYSEWGYDCLEKLNGIYAFAVWDEKNQKLFIARDRIGVKPLFFYPYTGGIIFASQIKTLLANPIVKPEIDEIGLKEIFLIGPGRTGGNGVIKGVEELKPGEFAIFDKSGLNIKKYWTLTAKEHSDNLSQTIEKTRYLINDAIKRQLVSDVPLCCFLSGGLDSSIISKTASDEYKKEGKKLTTYSVNYEDNEKYFKKSLFQPNSDYEYIKMMYEYIDSDHKEVILDNIQLAEALPASAIARDLPGMADIDSSLFLFCKKIKENFTVAVSGECADEIFGGYPWYHNKDILFEDTFPWSRSLEVRNKVLKDGLISGGDEYVRARYLETVNSTSYLDTDDKLNKRMREMFMLNTQWFMQTLLDRKDRMSMDTGLEVRVPFCDHKIVEYAYNMPWEMKALEGREKGIVREAMKGILPDEIVFRKKSPYPKTHNPVFMQCVVNGVKAIKNDSNSIVKDLINWQSIDEIIENPESLKSPWYGQLMGVPQILAYIIQLETWFKHFNINIV